MEVPRYHQEMKIQGITIEVGDLAAARHFYEDILGFVPGEFYEPTRWQPYDLGGRYFAIREIEHAQHRDNFDITNFDVDDVEALWARVKDAAEVAEGLATTPYGTYKFVLKDPDGYRLGFVGRKG